MNDSFSACCGARWLAAVALAASCLTGCGGTRVLEESVPLEVKHPLAIAADERMAFSLDWIVIRNGPGSWARDADWDGYQMRAQNRSGQTIHVTEVVVRDSMGTLVERRGSRRGLVRGTKLAARRYRDEGLEVHAGVSSEAMLAAGVAVGNASYGLALTYAAIHQTLGVGAGGLAAGLAGLFVVTPALIVSGVQRSKYDRAIEMEIAWRQTSLPVGLTPGEGKNVDLFFPVTPSPGEIEVTYVDADGEHKLTIDTRHALDGLHLRETAGRSDSRTGPFGETEGLAQQLQPQPGQYLHMPCNRLSNGARP